MFYKLNVLFIMMVLISAVHADITFLRNYGTECPWAEPADVIETSEGGYAFMTNAINWTFLRTDEYGEVLVQRDSIWDHSLCENQDAELVTSYSFFSHQVITITWADLMGNILRTAQFDEFIEYEYITPRCIIQTSDKGYAICGDIDSIYPYYAEGFILKLDSLENYEWDVVLQEGLLYTIAEDSDNCLIAGGGDYYVDYVLKLSQDGDIIWENEYSAPWAGVRSIVPTSSGYAFASRSGRVVGISSSGIFEWQYDATLPEIGYSDICVSPNGDVVACGYDWDFNAGGGPGVLTRLNPDGNPVWENHYENFGLYKIYSTADSGFVSAGRYTELEPPYGYAKLLLLKVDSEGNYVSTGIEEEPEWNNAQLFPVYPNPFSESATISYSLTDPGAVSIAIFDVSGRLVSSPVDCISAAGTYSFAINDLPSGIYMVRMRVAGREQVQRFVVMNKGV